MISFPHFKQLWPRNIDSAVYLESFLISAVSSILIIRAYLNITGYPQLGNGSFHIAHMLWGGLFMTLAIGLALTFFGKTTLRLAAILGGIGFGTFIDELGKFITSDNNYFFQPTVAVIYVIFILFYLGLQAFEKYAKFTRTEYLVNALEMTKEIIIKDLDPQEKAKVIKFLNKSDQSDEMVKILKDLIHQVDLVQPSEPNLFSKLKTNIQDLYFKLARNKYFDRAIIIFFIFQSFIAVYYAVKLTADITGIINIKLFEINSFSFIDSGQLIFSLISSVFILIGVFLLKKSRLASYLMFKRGLLVSIFLTQFFAFYKEQFSAVFGLIGNLIALIVLEYMIEREEKRKARL